MNEPGEVGPDGLTQDERVPVEGTKHLDQLLDDLAATVVNSLGRPEQRADFAMMAKIQRERVMARAKTHPDEIPTLETLEARHGASRILDDGEHVDPERVNRAIYAGLLAVELFEGGPSILAASGLMENAS